MRWFRSWLVWLKAQIVEEVPTHMNACLDCGRAECGNVGFQSCVNHFDRIEGLARDKD